MAIAETLKAALEAHGEYVVLANAEFFAMFPSTWQARLQEARRDGREGPNLVVFKTTSENARDHYVIPYRVIREFIVDETLAPSKGGPRWNLTLKSGGQLHVTHRGGAVDVRKFHGAQLLVEKMGDAPRTSPTTPHQFHAASVFLPLGAREIAKGDYVYAAAMTAGLKEHRAARAAGRTMPIIFGDASEDSGRLYKWAVLDEVEPADGSTRLRFSAVRDLDNHLAPELIKLSDRRPLSRNIRRGYSVVITPDFLRTGDPEKQGVDASLRSDLEQAANTAEATGAFDPRDVVDARDRTLTAIVRRRGQPAFRAALFRAYEGKCAISGCGVADVLEAAHIIPYQGPQTNDIRNGMLLRADLHILFNLGLIAVDTATMTILLARELSGSEYANLNGRAVRIPSRGAVAPSVAALDNHRRRSRL